ncbi:MAG: hypothetical protein AB7K24_02930 [Gemmataceae bacterium]
MKKWLGLVGVLAALAGILGWFFQDRLLSWYYVQQLATADADRDTWAQQAAGLGSAAVNDLVGCLRREDAKACANAAHCLALLIDEWGPSDQRTAALIQKLADDFDALSVPGKQAAVELACKESVPVQALRQLLGQAARVPEVRKQVLVLACRVPTSPELNTWCSHLVCGCIADKDPATRIQAVELAFRCGIPEQTVTLLRDQDAEVRRAAMLRLGPAPDVIGTDELLYWLHDSDPVVCKLCESALRGRGLLPEHLQMGRLITDPRSTNRLKVLDHLDQNGEVEPGIWLRRLSHDPSPAVRAASIRAASEQIVVDLSDRIEQMAANDPSPTVRQLARFYLNCQNLP